MFENFQLYSFLISFLTVYLVTPRLIPLLEIKKLTGKDMNKANKPEIPAIGGIAVQLGFYAGVMSYIVFVETLSNYIFVFILVSIGVGLIGIIDDIIILRQSHKALLPFLVAIPTGFFLSTVIPIPFLGFYDFGMLMLFLSPFGITCGANAANMLEGFNGLGVGMLSIIVSCMVFLMFFNESYSGLLITLPLLGSLLAFLYYNKYPAKIFPGDSTMVFAGGCIVLASYLSNLRAECAFLFIPFIIEFILKGIHKFSTQCFSEDLEGNFLVYNGRISSLTHFVMKNWNVTERSLVFIFYIFQLFLSFVVIFLTYNNVF